jgi:hypothetical protein
MAGRARCSNGILQPGADFTVAQAAGFAFRPPKATRFRDHAGDLPIETYPSIGDWLSGDLVGQPPECLPDAYLPTLAASSSNSRAASQRSSRWRRRQVTFAALPPRFSLRAGCSGFNYSLNSRRRQPQRLGAERLPL